MTGALTLILICQLAGESLAAWLGLPVPGPVIGMALLFAILVLRGHIDEPLAIVGDGLLRNLALLFVPAGTGVMVHLGLIGAEWPAISLALLGSTAVAIIVTGLLMSALQRRTKGRSDA